MCSSPFLGKLQLVHNMRSLSFSRVNDWYILTKERKCIFSSWITSLQQGVIVSEIRLRFSKELDGFMIFNNIHSYACVDFIFHGMSWLPGGVRKAYFLGLHEWVGPLSKTFTFFWSINCWWVAWWNDQKWNKQSPMDLCASLWACSRGLTDLPRALGDAPVQWCWLKSGRGWYWDQYLLVPFWFPQIEK